MPVILSRLISIREREYGTIIGNKKSQDYFLLSYYTSTQKRCGVCQFYKKMKIKGGK